MRTLMNFPYKNFAPIAFKVVGGLLLFVALSKLLPSVAGTILCLLLLGGYYYVIGCCLKFCDVNFREVLMNDLPRILIVAAIATGFIVFMINAQQTIYTGDSLETYEPTLRCEETAFSEPIKALRNLRSSINHDDYNNFLPMLMALPMHIFGRSFLCYTLYVWLMFALPAILIAAATLKTHLDNAGIKTLPCSALMAILLLLPICEVPIFVGYANISIWLPGAVILATLLSLDKSQLQRDRLIFIAILCICAVFQARTAAYMILGEFFGYTVYVMLSSLQEKNFLQNVLMLCQKFLFIGVAALLMMLPFFFTFVKHALTYDIGSAYSAYQLGHDFLMRLKAHAGYLGFLIYAIFFVGASWLLRNKKFFPLAAFFLTWTLAPSILICRIQLMDRQHYYTILLPLAFIIAAFLVDILSKKKIVGAALIVFLSFNFLQTYTAPFDSQGFLSANYSAPVRHDIDDLKNFVAYLNRLSRNGEKKIYPLADSALYNCHTLKKIYIPDDHDALPNLFYNNEIDLRDGFAPEFFDSDIVLVTEPLQLHLRAEDQTVVVALAEFMTTSSPISEHFKKVKEYTFNATGNDVTFIVYEKISPFEKSDIEFVEKFFVERYPDKDDLFKNRFEKYKRKNF